MHDANVWIMIKIRFTNVRSSWIPHDKIDGSSVGRYIVDNSIHWCHHENFAAFTVCVSEWGNQFGRQRIDRKRMQRVFVIGAFVEGSHGFRRQIVHHNFGRIRASDYQVGFVPRMPSKEVNIVQFDDFVRIATQNRQFAKYINDCNECAIRRIFYVRYRRRLGVRCGIRCVISPVFVRFPNFEIRIRQKMDVALFKATAANSLTINGNKDEWSFCMWPEWWILPNDIFAGWIPGNRSNLIGAFPWKRIMFASSRLFAEFQNLQHRRKAVQISFGGAKCQFSTTRIEF